MYDDAVIGLYNGSGGGERMKCECFLPAKLERVQMVFKCVCVFDLPVKAFMCTRTQLFECGFKSRMKNIKKCARACSINIRV